MREEKRIVFSGGPADGRTEVVQELQNMFEVFSPNMSLIHCGAQVNELPDDPAYETHVYGRVKGIRMIENRRHYVYRYIGPKKKKRKVQITSVCSDEMHDNCSGRVVTNPEAGWHRARYTPCECKCHKRVKS